MNQTTNTKRPRIVRTVQQSLIVKVKPNGTLFNIDKRPNLLNKIQQNEKSIF